MDTESWIVVIGLMNVLVGLLWVLQTKGKTKRDTVRAKKPD
ncbi:hypothetical protein [Sulfitobacter sp. JB4-11]